MATTVARLEAVLAANTRSFDSAMDKSQGKMHTVGKAAGIAGAAILGGLAVGLDKSVHAAVDAQVSQSRLEQAFKTAHLAISAYKGSIDEAEKSGRKLGFTDEDVRTSLGSLVTATHNYRKAQHELGIAEDIARFKHVSLTDATKMLTMAQTGSQRAAKQLGITVPPVTAAYDALGKNASVLEKAQAKVTDKMATGNAVIEAVRKHVQGQGEAYSKTAAGGMAQFHAQTDHLEVALGRGLLPIMTTVATTLANLTEFFAKHTTATKILVISLGILGGVLLTISASMKIAAAATKVWTAAQWLLNAALTANPIGIVIVALAALGLALVVAYNKVAFFRNGVNEAWSWIKDHWPLLVGIIGGPIGIAVEQIIVHRNRLVEIFRNLPGMIVSALGDLKQLFFHNIIDKFTGAIDDGVGAVKRAITSLFNKVVDWALHALGIRSPSTVFYGIGQNAIQGFIDGVGSMAGKLKDAVVHVASHYLSDIGSGVTGAIGAIPGAKGTIVGEGKKSGVHASPDLAKQFAVTQMKNFGWGPSQMAALAPLWTGESGWRWNALNSSSGAYGIPQSLPASKMASAGSDWHENAFTQIIWGLRYIKDRYGSPSNAYSAWQHRSPHWYDRGGWLPTGLSLAMNNTGKPERVLGPGEVANLVINYNGTVIHEKSAAQQILDLLRREQRNGPLGLAGT